MNQRETSGVQRSSAINLRIERLILEGLSIEAGDRPSLQAAIEVELSRLLMAGGLNSELLSGGASPSMNGGEIQLTNGTGAARLGAQIAGAIYQNLGTTGD